MRKIRHFFLTTAAVLCSTLTTWAAYNGTPATPSVISGGDFDGYYAISTAEELYGFAELVNGGTAGAKAVLTADIVVNLNVPADGNLNGATMHSWTPIGTNAYRFNGTFDGNGHTISGLYFNNTTNSSYPNGGNYVGLIGYANRATIKNVGVIDSYLNGYKNIGGICGYGYDSFTTITNCYNTGTVSGSQYVGGICGQYGTQTNCYNTGTVSAPYGYVGGICGQYGKQTNCYNIGTVSGSGTTHVGGICGRSGTITNCYYLEGCGSQNTLGTSATAEEFASGKITYILNGSTSGNNNAWRQTLGNGNDAYPVLDKNHSVVYATQPCTSGFSNTGGVVKEHPSVDATGHCTACGKFAYQGTLVTESNYSSYGLTADFIDYYAISNTADLYWVANEVNNGNATINAVLTKDITVNTTVLNEDGTLNGTPTYSWTPIGTSSNNFKGTFDGNNHTISGLYFENTTSNNYPNGGTYVGLIGYAYGATIKNVGVVDSYIKGHTYVGGICGYVYNSNTTITNCYNTGTVSGTNDVGGICGEEGTQTNCHNTGTVSGSGSIVGGICGQYGTQTKCYNTGAVSGSGTIGGICGQYGTQTSCYNTGTVSGSSSDVGGICGWNGTQINCYNTGTVSGSNSEVGGICGCRGTQTNCYYLAGCAKDGNNVVQYGVGNATKGQTTADVTGKTMSATTEDFESGQMTYILNGSTSEVDLTWYQTLGNGSDASPVLDNTHAVVYVTQPCTSEFSNTRGAVKEHPLMDATGRCTACGQFTVQGTLVTESNYSSLNLSADFVGYYAISNTAELYWLADEVNNGNTTINAVLTADIVVNENVLNADGTLNGTPTYSWTPIGTYTYGYAGIFDGNNHTISGLYFDNTTDSNYPDGGNKVGLIGYANGAAIKNVGVVDSYISGKHDVGGICGYNGSQTNCYNAGKVSGSGHVGGICGYNGSQTNCYNTGTVSGSDYVGGICGNGVTQTNCYNTGTVSGSQYVGGICGCGYILTNCYNIGTVMGSANTVGGICSGANTITDCYYLEGCGNKNSFGTSASAEQFASGKIAYLLNGSTSGGNLAWYQTIGTDAYPIFDNTHAVVYVKQPCTSEFSNTEGAVKEHPSMDKIGRCTACSQFFAQGTFVTESNYSSLNLTADFVGYYAISNTAELYWLAREVNNGYTTIYAVLTDDIVVNENVLKSNGTLNGTPTYSWTPIGTSSKNFKGTFDGNGHTISGLYFNNTTSGNYPDGGQNVGLIGYAYKATIKNVGVIDSYIRGYQYIGGICGNAGNYTTITNCYNTGTVSGSTYSVGGICGYNGTQTNCYNTGAVSGIMYVGGICGNGYEGSRTNCYYLTGCAKDGDNVVQYGVGNVTRGQTTADVAGKTISATVEEFASGKIAYLLNGSSNTTWHQNLFADAVPVLDVTHNSVTGYVEEEDNVITVYGNLLVASNYEVAAGKTLLIPADASVTTTGDAVITNNGTIIANGSIAGNNLAGNGNFYYNVLAEADVTITTPNVTYIGAALTLDNNVRASFSTRTFCGKTFTFDASLTTVSYENNRNVGDATVTWTNANGSSVSKAFSITPKTLTISNIKAENKVYDGNTTTTVSYDADVFAVDIDKVTFGTAATFDDKTARTGKTVSFSYTKSGDQANNYAFASTTGTTTANIEQLELVISKTEAAGKVYDGNTATTVTIEASNIVSGDEIIFGTTAAFEDKNVGTNKDVNFDFTKSGADAANYKFAAATGTVKAAITARSLTLSNFKADSKTYDATTNATGGQFSDDRVSGDVLEFSYNYSFTDKNVGNGKDVNFSSIAISGGADKDNYTLVTTSGKATADITVKTLAISNIKAENKTYDGNTATTVSYDADVCSGDNVTFGKTATFDDKTARAGKTVSFNYTKSGADAANYAFANESGSTTANIEPRELAISSVSAASKEYDGNTATTMTIAASNIVSGDVVTFGTAAAFADKNVGTNKTVNFTYTKSGADAANYSFAQATGTAKANITAKGLTLSNFTAGGKTFDGTTNATGGAFSDDRVSGDALEFSFNYAFANMNAANAVAVNFSNIAISGGADKDNYTLLTTTGTCSAKISPVTDEVVLNFTMPTRTVMYNGQANRYEMPTADELFSTNNDLYRMYGGFQPADNDAFQAARENVLAQTEVGEYTFGYNSGTLVNTSANFTNVTFNVTDGKLIITPKTGVVVTITENSSELTYNTEEQRVEGYTYSIDDELGIYSEDDFAFSGNAVVAGTTVGTYPMELSAADFSNTNANFAEVRFVIVDGALTITKAPEAPNKPEATMETRYIVTQLVELPENWKWADEQQALEEGSNVATANYVGADKGNYVIESVDVTITRLECLHNEGNEVLYTLEPTCTHKGYTGNLSCKLCGEIYEMGDSIPALGHDFVETVVAPTCTTDGYTTHFCARDNYTEYSDTVPATGHKEDVAVFENIVAATCTEAGSQDSVVYCSVCKDELSRTVLEIPATGHKDSVAIENIVRPTLEAAGSYDSVVYCSVCKVELSRKTIDVLASAVAVSKLPNKVEYKQGEALDVKGGKLTATYSDKSTEDFEMLAGWVSGFDSQKVGEQKLTVTFESVSSTLTTTFNVTVSAKDDDNTAIDEDAAEISIYAYQNVIVVENATEEISIYNAMGALVCRDAARHASTATGLGARTEIRMNTAGIYIVKVGNVAKRVMVND